MGDPEGWPQPSGLLPEGSSVLFSSLDDERWVQAENRTAELIARIQPTRSSEEMRRAVADYVQRLIRKCFDCEVFTFGSVPLKTYLPDGDIDLTAFSGHLHLQESWANDVRSVLEAEERNKDAEFRVKEVQYIQAEVKIIKCLVENIVVDISFNQLGGLCTLCFLEEVDRLIGQEHLFKRSIILVKAWCYYESRILGAHHGLISTYALETLVLYIFHVFHASLRGPLGVLYRFLEFFSNFDWDKYCLSLWGPVPLAALPEMQAEAPRRDGGPLLLSRNFLETCSRAYAVMPNGNLNGTIQSRVFGSKYLNVVDPLKTANNLGRSVNKGNFYRIRNAFGFGARKLARILECSPDDVVDQVDKFFLNTWDRHGSGRRPDAPDFIERISSPDEKQSSEGSPRVTDKDPVSKDATAGEVIQELNNYAVRTQLNEETQEADDAAGAEQGRDHLEYSSAASNRDSAPGPPPPPGERWATSAEPGIFPYPHGGSHVYSGLSPPPTDVTVPSSPSSEASSPVYSSQRPSTSIGIPLRKHTPADGQAPFYYTPFSYVPLYNSYYVLPPESGGDSDALNELPPFQLQEDGHPPPPPQQMVYGVGERLSAAGIPVTGGGRVEADADRFSDGFGAHLCQSDLLSSDFANHLRNLDYGRACQTGPVFLPQHAFAPFAKELQGHFIWEGPGRPHSNARPGGSSRFPRRSFPAPYGFNGDSRSGTGTYLPGARQTTYRDRQYRGQHDGYQEREREYERDVPPRYQRGVGRGQNSRVGGHGKTGTGDNKGGWHESFNRNAVHAALPVTLPPPSAGSVLTTAGVNLEAAYTQAYVNGNGNSSTHTPPLIVLYPSNEPLEFGTLGPMQAAPEHGAGRGCNPKGQAPAAALPAQAPAQAQAQERQQQQPSSPQQAAQRQGQRAYQMKEEDFPPLSFRAQGGNGSAASSTGTGGGTRSSPYQTYVASQSPARCSENRCFCKCCLVLY